MPLRDSNNQLLRGEDNKVINVPFIPRAFRKEHHLPYSSQVNEDHQIITVTSKADDIQATCKEAMSLFCMEDSGYEIKISTEKLMCYFFDMLFLFSHALAVMYQAATGNIRTTASQDDL